MSSRLPSLSGESVFFFEAIIICKLHTEFENLCYTINVLSSEERCGSDFTNPSAEERFHIL